MKVIVHGKTKMVFLWTTIRILYFETEACENFTGLDRGWIMGQG